MARSLLIVRVRGASSTLWHNALPYQLGQQRPPGRVLWAVRAPVLVYMTGPAKGRHIAERIRGAARLKRRDVVRFQPARVAALLTAVGITIERGPPCPVPEPGVQAGIVAASGVFSAHGVIETLIFASSGVF